MLALQWLAGLLHRRTARMLATASGVALAVALLASVGAFVASSAALMTERAVANVPVDWQVLLAPGSEASAVESALGEVEAVEPVAYASTDGFSASTDGTVQTTGPGKVLGVAPTYARTFPAELRLLLGTLDGVLVAQQTSANLHVTVGDTVTVARIGLPPSTVRVDGIVDLPYADSLFQAVGVPAGVAPQAPPDNVLLLPEPTWHALFDEQAIVRPDSIRTQLHVRLPHESLPHDPAAAFTYVRSRSNNFEARVAGSAMVGDNLQARLDGVRADALYAQVMFLFLGLPGAVLAGLLTLGVAASGADRRRREHALLRVRGASPAQVLWLSAIEALTVGVLGLCLGLGTAILGARAISPSVLPVTPLVGLWIGGAALIGFVLALAACLLPAWRQVRSSTVAAARAPLVRPGRPFWQRVYADVILLLVAAAAYWQASTSGYHLVLAPEGVAQTSVSYQAFLGPLGLWLGMGLMAMRLCGVSLTRGTRFLSWALRPITGALATVASSALRRQRVLLTRAMMLVVLAFAFATSTASFNATYNAQSLIDAALTNGADVSVTAAAPWAGDPELDAVRGLRGVLAAQPMQHRLAYVGTDLQDLYGIDPMHLGEATTLANSYFASGDAAGTLAALAARADALLVSAETASDYQLQPGDRVNLRLQNAHDHQYHAVPFTFVGIVREFPTAPRDSFLVAQAAYVAEQTGVNGFETVLLRTREDPASVASQVRSVVSTVPGARVNDVGSTHATISSSLTAVDLRGLTQLELAFAVVLVAGAAGLVLWLGLAERRRTFAVLVALGATRNQLGSLLLAEGAVILPVSAALGIALGVAVAQMLVILLTGVFDPAPEAVVIPWAYVAMVTAAAMVSTAAALAATHLAAQQHTLEVLRDL